ncbi:mRNA 3' end processing factor, partial [Dispira parvispora]
ARPREKLPSLYLIDSICKIVRGPYIHLFEKDIVDMFTKAYPQVSPKDQYNFRRVLKTWKQNPGGPIFSETTTSAIEHRLGLAEREGPPPTRTNGSHPPKRSSVPIDNPPQQSSAAIAAQTASLLSAWPNLAGNLNMTSTSGLPQPTANAPSYGTPTTTAALLQSLLNPSLGLLQSLPLLNPQARTVPSAPVFPSGLPQGPGNITSAPSTVKPKPTIRIPLTNEELVKKRPGLVECLYRAIPLQCKQCGARYPGTDQGRKHLDAHLDWHFRRNRKQKEKSRQAQPHGWFVSEEDWVSCRLVAAEELSTAAIFESGNVDSSVSQSAVATDHHNDTLSPQESSTDTTDESVLRSMFVVVPPQDHNLACPICSEKLTGVWDEEEEEWVYRNAIDIDGIIHHATCHRDQQREQRLGSSAGDMDSTHKGVKRKSSDGMLTDSDDSSLGGADNRHTKVKRENSSAGFSPSHPKYPAMPVS